MYADNRKTAKQQNECKTGEGTLWQEEQKQGPWAETLTPEERLKNFMDAFGKLNINDFMRSYTNRAVHIEEPSEQEKNPCLQK